MALNLTLSLTVLKLLRSEKINPTEEDTENDKNTKRRDNHFSGVNLPKHKQTRTRRDR